MKLLQETLGWNFTSDATATLFIETTLRVSLLLMVTGCVGVLAVVPTGVGGSAASGVWVLAIVGWGGGGGGGGVGGGGGGGWGGGWGWGGWGGGSETWGSRRPVAAA